MKTNFLLLFALLATIFPFLSHADDDLDDLSIEDREIEPLPQTDARINGYREDYKKPKGELIQIPEKYKKKKKKSNTENLKITPETEPIQKVQPAPATGSGPVITEKPKPAAIKNQPQTEKRSETNPQNKLKPGYYGETVDGVREGKGKLVTENNDLYDGNWKNGKKHGQGIYIYSNGIKYNGTWKNDRMDGYGSLIFPNGSSYYGEFRDGEITGTGTFKYADKTEYSGGWKNGKWHGRGCFKLANGKEIKAVFNNQQIVTFINDDGDSE
ncbi:hypothetical protein J6Z19_02590 [bacterium]|nr:hypothetical protein [bacterium]